MRWRNKLAFSCGCIGDSSKAAQVLHSVIVFCFLVYLKYQQILMSSAELTNHKYCAH